MVSLEDAFQKVRLDLSERVISDKPQKQQEFLDILASTVNDFKKVGINSMDCEQFASGLSEQMGRLVTTREIGKYRGKLGLGKRKKHDGSSFYEFVPVK